MFNSACQARVQRNITALELLDLSKFRFTDGSFRGRRISTWMKFEDWIINHSSVMLENVRSEMFNLVSVHPENSIAQAVASRVISLSSLNKKTLLLRFPNLKSLNITKIKYWTVLWKWQRSPRRRIYPVWPKLETISIQCSTNVRTTITILYVCNMSIQIQHMTY
jgi:hypothetical protein